MTYRQLKQLTIVWILAIVIGSISPVEVKEAVGTETQSHSSVVRTKTFNFHRVMHYIAFGVGAALLVAISRTAPQRVLLCLGLIVLGCLLEWVQHRFLGSRHLETWDMRDDAFATGAGAALSLFFHLGVQARRKAFPQDFVKQ